MRRRLARAGYPSKVIEGTLERLHSLNYINDEKFARDRALQRSESEGYGPKRIEQELIGKGISEPLVDKILRETCSEKQEKENARTLLEKTYSGKNLNDPKILRRAVTFLQRRGYNDHVISDLLGYPEDA